MIIQLRYNFRACVCLLLQIGRRSCLFITVGIPSCKIRHLESSRVVVLLAIVLLVTLVFALCGFLACTGVAENGVRVPGSRRRGPRRLLVGLETRRVGKDGCGQVLHSWGDATLTRVRFESIIFMKRFTCLEADPAGGAEENEEQLDLLPNAAEESVQVLGDAARKPLSIEKQRMVFKKLTKELQARLQALASGRWASMRRAA